jgi:hypothetical protein
MIDFFNFDSFSHGQIASKQWLCENLEKFLHDNDRIAILGSWYNVLGFMLKIRGNNQHISAIDKDSAAVEIANKITNCWNLYGQLDNLVGSAESTDLSEFSVIINTSSEHMNSDWFDNIKFGTLVCVQSSDIVDSRPPWLISNPSPTFNDFLDKYPMSSRLFIGQKFFDYVTLSYNRFMILGIK